MTAKPELYSDAFFADPFAYYANLREVSPVLWDEAHEMWILTRHEDVSRVARSPKVFSSRLAALDTRPPPLAVRPADEALKNVVDAIHVKEFIQMDPPEHTGKRSCLAPLFAQRTLAALRTSIAEIVGGLLDGIAGADGPVDLRARVAGPLPLLVISRLIGIPAPDVDLIAEQARMRMTAVLSLDDDRLPVSVAGFEATAAYLDTAVDERRREGCPASPDVLSRMAEAEAAGEYSRPETLANAMMLIDAGHETTIQLICNGTLQLLRRPEQWRRLVAEPRRLAPQATDECLRFDPPLHVLRRIVATDTEIAGQTLHAGERVFAVVASANRDPRRFDDPDQFDIGRHPNPHLSFGAGAHFCLGRHLARLEAEEYFVALAGRFPRLELATPGRAEYHRAQAVRSLVDLPVTLG